MLGRPTTCPDCYGGTFYASTSGWRRRLLAALLVRPFRCGDCHRRVWRLALRPGPARPPKPAARPADCGPLHAPS
jgi:hypothetical protein